MSKITKRIKIKQEESRKKRTGDKVSVQKTENVVEDIKVSDIDKSKDVLKKSFANLSAKVKQSIGGYGNQSVTPISVTPSISTQVQPPIDQNDAEKEQLPAIEQKKSKVTPFLKNVGSILRDQIGDTSIGQFASMTSDITKQFKDLFKTQEELFAEQVIEEAKTKKKEADRKEKEDKLREEILKKAGLLVEKQKPEKNEQPKQKTEKKEKQPVGAPQQNDVTVNKQIADDIQRIRVLMESEAQQSAHALEEQVEQARQQNEVVKTLKGIEENLKKEPSVVKDEAEKGLLSSLLSSVSGMTNFSKVIGSLTPLVAGLTPIFTGLAAALLPVSGILGVVGAGLFAFNEWIDSRASENRGTEQWKEKASPEELKKWQEEEAVYNKALEDSKARKIEKAEVEKVHAWDKTNEALEKSNSLSRVVDGKITKDWELKEDGTYSHKTIEQIETKPEQVQLEQSPVPQPSVELAPQQYNSSVKLTETMTDEYNRAQLKQKEETKESPPVIIQPNVSSTNDSKHAITLFDNRRNSDDTFQRMNNVMFRGAHI